MNHARVDASPSIAASSAVDLCAYVDDLAPDATGELVFRRGTTEGAVFVENGRVCWAAARGLARRLTGLLGSSAKLDAAAMEVLYAHCKRQGTPLGEHLLGQGLVSAPELRDALLRHTAESLLALCGTGAVADWTPRRKGGYSSRFTFTTTELLTWTLAGEHPTESEAASVELVDAFVERDWGAAYLRSPKRASPDPIAIVGPCPPRVEALFRLGRWASSSLDIAGLAHGERAFVATVVDGGALVAWRCQSVVIAGWTSHHGPARLLNRRARARRKDLRHGGL